MPAKPSRNFFLALDAGTTAVKAFVFRSDGQLVAKEGQRLHKDRLKSGWVEQDPREILSVSRRVLKDAVRKSGVKPKNIVAFGITNQRETVIAWDRKTGRVLHPAIIWEDRRTSAWCRARKGWTKFLRRKTGLPLDAYFSAPKIRWLLDHVGEVSRLVATGRLMVGTVDTWLLWNLCDGHPHVTDETNASRTLLFNIRTRRWDPDLLRRFDIPIGILPRVFPSRAAFGKLRQTIVGAAIPVRAVCGDQQASFYAAVRRSGGRGRVTKVTYGTGAFILQDAGSRFALRPSFFTTIAPGRKGTRYVLETKIEGTGKDVDRLLRHPKALERYFFQLAKKIQRKLSVLPASPFSLVIDGGITRDGRLGKIQAAVSKVSVITQPIYDGTALGIAWLLGDTAKKRKTVP